MEMFNMKNIMSSLAMVVILGWSGCILAEISVIVHPSSEINSLTRNEISRLFLGKITKIPAGAHAIPINQDEGTAEREKFIAEVCKKTSSAYKAHWSRLVFTGKGVAPQNAGDDAAIKAMVASNPKLIGYIDSSLVDATVKVVFNLP